MLGTAIGLTPCETVSAIVAPWRTEAPTGGLTSITWPAGTVAL